MLLMIEMPHLSGGSANLHMHVVRCARTTSGQDCHEGGLSHINPHLQVYFCWHKIMTYLLNQHFTETVFVLLLLKHY